MYYYPAGISRYSTSRLIKAQLQENSPKKPVICKFVSRLTKGKVLEIHLRTADVNSASISLSDGNVPCDVKIFEHLTPKKQNLLYEAKKFKVQYHYHFQLLG